MLSPHPNRSQRTRQRILVLAVLAIIIVFTSELVVDYFLRPVIPPYLLDTIVYASLFGLMAMGLTLTYITTKVPNFAYCFFVTVGIYTSYYMFLVNSINLGMI